MKPGQAIRALGRWMIIEEVDTFKGVRYLYTIDREGESHEITEGMVDHIYD